MVLKLYHPWPFLNFCDHICKHETKSWGNSILTIARTVFLLFNFILQYILWPPHYHWVLKYHTLRNTALLFNFILQYILWPPHYHWVLKYHTLRNTGLRLESGLRQSLDTQSISLPLAFSRQSSFVTELPSRAALSIDSSWNTSGLKNSSSFCRREEKNQRIFSQPNFLPSSDNISPPDSNPDRSIHGQKIGIFDGIRWS